MLVVYFSCRWEWHCCSLWVWVKRIGINTLSDFFGWFTVIYSMFYLKVFFSTICVPIPIQTINIITCFFDVTLQTPEFHSPKSNVHIMNLTTSYYIFRQVFNFLFHVQTRHMRFCLLWILFNFTRCSVVSYLCVLFEWFTHRLNSLLLTRKTEF